VVEEARTAAPDVVAFVVAGGQSRRMGRDKALLPWGGATLLDHAIQRLRAVSDDVRILCGPDVRYADRGLPVVPDAARGQGALGGVLSGLLALERGVGIFLAVDLPAVPVVLLRGLVAASRGWDAVVPFSPGGPEPLCAVYALACAGPIRRRLEAGEAKMTSFWPGVRVRHLAPAELARYGNPARLFANVNDEGDYTRLRRSGDASAVIGEGGASREKAALHRWSRPGRG
jgi:molybdopterin-guanine dinucleotide biosynthesis protein A